MSFEDELRQTVEREVAARVAQAEARVREEAHAAGYAAALADGRAAGHGDSRYSDTVAGPAQDREDEEAPTLDRLARAIRYIDRGGSLTEILDALCVSASHEAARVALLMLNGAELQGWRFVGFDVERPDLLDARRFVLPLAEAGVVADAVRDRESRCSETMLPEFARTTAGGAGNSAAAIPLIVGGRVVAVVYGDRPLGAGRAGRAGGAGGAGRAGGAGEAGEAGGQAAWASSFEILAACASRRLEFVTTLRSSQLLAHWPDAFASSTFSPGSN